MIRIGFNKSHFDCDPLQQLNNYDVLCAGQKNLFIINQTDAREVPVDRQSK